MRISFLFFCCLMFLLPCFGQDPAPVSSAAAPVQEGSGIGSLIWTFCNSSLGMTLIGGVLVFVLGKIFTAKPAWEVAYSTYKAPFFTAVRQAEKAIPDGTPNVALARFDAAMKYLLQLEPRLAKVKQEDRAKAINVAHAVVEKKDEAREEV